MFECVVELCKVGGGKVGIFLLDFFCVDCYCDDFCCFVKELDYVIGNDYEWKLFY